MAGDWIKMSVNLDENPHVLRLAAELSRDALHVVGMLWKVWAWADLHTLDGNDVCVTENVLDRFTNCPGFAVGLRKVGWLEGRDYALTFPRFAKHNGQTAKNRALTLKRVRKVRNDSVTHGALPEKRREEERRDSCPTDKKTPTPLPPELDTDDFRKAWADWCQHRSEIRKPLKPTAMANKLRDLARLGSARAVAAIRHSIGNGWQGIFEPKDGDIATGGGSVVARALESLTEEMHAEEARLAKEAKR